MWKAGGGVGGVAAYVHRKVRAANDARRAIAEVTVSLLITGG